MRKSCSIHQRKEEDGKQGLVGEQSSSNNASSVARTPFLRSVRKNFQHQTPSRQLMRLSMEDKLRDKFRGCLVGALVGDCIGTLYEGDYTVSASILGDLYLSLTNLSEDEKLMDLHGIDFGVGPKLAQELLERKRSTIAQVGIDNFSSGVPEGEQTGIHSPLKRHSSCEGQRRGSFSRPIERFSDDTIMNRSVVRSLIRMKGLDPKDMAKQLTEDYFLNLTRKYGGYSRDIFTQLRNTGYCDPYCPARKSIGNIGAQGNEGATRVAPVALFGWNSDPCFVAEMASKLTKITNYHRFAVIGAAFQALSVHTAFNWDFIKENKNEPGSRGRLRSRLKTPSPTVKRKVDEVLQTDQENIPMNSTKNEEVQMDFDYKLFCNHLLEGISNAESKTATLFENLKSLMHSRDANFTEKDESAYSAKIKIIVEFMGRPEAPSRAEVVEKLGNAVKAIDSVPTALFSFLMSARSTKFPELPVHIKSPVLRSIFYAISLGGDSDTTASMAGAIAGAYWGYEKIPQEILRVCEGSRDIKKLADELFDHCQGHSTSG